MVSPGTFPSWAVLSTRAIPSWLHMSCPLTAPAHPCLSVGMNPTGTANTAVVPTMVSHGQQMLPCPGEGGCCRTPILLISASSSFLSRAGPLSVVGSHLCSSPALCSSLCCVPQGGVAPLSTRWVQQELPSLDPRPRSPAPRQWGRPTPWALNRLWAAPSPGGTWQHLGATATGVTLGGPTETLNYCHREAEGAK